MSTRSLISIKNPDGSYDAVYCHFDGKPDIRMPILTKHYNTKRKVKKLLEPGDISHIEEKCDCPKGHTFDNPVDNYTVYYGRDRGESNTQKRNLLNIEELGHYAKNCNAEYIYIFDKEWMWF